jgi:ATP-dependent Clp protease ATP-binding subunit ClpC
MSLDDIKNTWPYRYEMYLRMVREMKQSRNEESSDGDSQMSEEELSEMKKWLTALNSLDTYITKHKEGNSEVTLRERQLTVFEDIRKFLEHGGTEGYVKLPTGVGKTELAKTIATTYFGGEHMMVRLDMSEYQDKSSIYRLIGLPGAKATGILTEAIHKTPFSLLLLDEIEKADPDILNLFLQVMDDGRLTDSSGTVFDFTNVIIIATSNAGTLFVQEQGRKGVSHEELLNQLLHEELKHYFRPEFLNRFDGVILFNSLSKEHIKHIAGLMIDSIAKEMENKGIMFSATDEALEFLADAGFDPEFGARPMRRALQEKVENKIAELMLQSKLKRGSRVTIGAAGALFIE